MPTRRHALPRLEPLELRWVPTKVGIDASGLMTISGFKGDLTVTQSSTVPGRFTVTETVAGGSESRIIRDVTAVTITGSQKGSRVAVDLGGFGLVGTLTIDCGKGEDVVDVSAADGAAVQLNIHLGGGADTLTLAGWGMYSGIIDGGSSSQNHDRPPVQDIDTLVVDSLANLSGLAILNFEVA